MFKGLSNISVDAKGRLAIPVKYRERLQEMSVGNLVVTIDPTNKNAESCLLIYPLGEWEKIQAKIDQLSSFDARSRKVQRLLVGHADDVTMDASGRVLLNAELRAYAGIEKKAVLIGQGKKFELWNEETWQQCREGWLQEAQEDDAELPADLSSLSL